MIQELGDLEPLIPLKNLTNLCLLQNPVSAKPQYRQYIVYRFPQLRLLDFRKIKQAEREAATEYFRSKRGKEMAREIAKKVKQTAGTSVDKPLTTPEERNKIREAITNASSLEEVQRLSKLLQAGHIPGEERLQNGTRAYIHYSTIFLKHIRYENDQYGFCYCILCYILLYNIVFHC